MDRGGTQSPQSPYQRLEVEGSSTDFECLQGLDHGRICGLVQYHGGGIHKETNRFGFSSDVRFGTGDSHSGRAILDLLSPHSTSWGKNVLADQLSRPDQMHSTEWYLLIWVSDTISKKYRCPVIDVFVTRANTKLPLYMFPVPDPTAQESTFQHM